MQEQFSFLTKVKLTAAQKDVFTQDTSFILMTGPDVSIETSQLRSLASHQSTDLHLVPFVDRAAPWVTESWLLERGTAVDLLNVLEQVQFRPIMVDKWQKSLNIWANYVKEITKVSRKYVDSWFGNMEKIWQLFLWNYSTDIKKNSSGKSLNQLDVFYECLLPWWCGPLRQTRYICHQSQPRLQQPGVPQGRGVGWCRSARPCPRRRWSGPWSRWPSGHLRSVDEERPRCGESVCSVPRLSSPPKLCRRGETGWRWRRVRTEQERGEQGEPGKKRRCEHGMRYKGCRRTRREKKRKFKWHLFNSLNAFEAPSCWTLKLNSLEKLTSKPTNKMTVKLLLRKWSHIFPGHGPANMVDVWRNKWINAELCVAAKHVSM